MSDESLRQKLETIQMLAEECLKQLGHKKHDVSRPEGAANTAPARDEDTAVKIANKVADCDENQKIQSNVLDKRDMEGKILLCFYISYKYFGNAWLTTGDIEKITTDLGVKIDARNVTNKMKELRQFLESGAVRKKGQPTPYRLNRNGMKRFQDILQ